MFTQQRFSLNPTQTVVKYGMETNKWSYIEQVPESLKQQVCLLSVVLNQHHLPCIQCVQDPEI